MHNILRFILFCRITYDPFCSIKIKNHDVRQIRFHVCIKMRRCKRRVCKRKTFFGQSNGSYMYTKIYEMKVMSTYIYRSICYM